MKIKRVLRWMGILGAILFVLVLLAGLGLWWLLRASLAQLDGRRPLPGLQAGVVIERDSLGVPTIRATNRIDATRALGFLHAQERFFQMDLSRRAGAGELCELFGPMALGHDRIQRMHRPRARAKRAFESFVASEAALLKAYSEGVNAGLRALTARPPEYLGLRVAPAPRQPEDTCLVAYAMFGDLHDTEGNNDLSEEVFEKAFSPAARAFFNAPDSAWSAALDGSRLTTPPVPTAVEFSVNENDHQAVVPRRDSSVLGKGEDGLEDEWGSRSGTIGSNNWAVAGRRSGTGSAIVANDMHLGLRVPNTWFRARLIYHDPELGLQDVTGVTLPGTPVVVSGSNGHVAWGNTASCLDVTDLVRLELDTANPHRYRTPAGWREMDTFSEVIRVHNGTNEVVAVEETVWGPVVTRGGTRYALASTIHEPDAVNMGLIQVERARDTQSALLQANLAGTPVNNFIVGDRAGHIGYSLLGRLPKRAGFDGATPCSWSDGTKGWQGWVPPKQYPRLVDPTNGVLWSANNRTLGSPDYSRLHICSPDNGARARQIRDDLLALDKATERTLWSIYTDDRALFLGRWQKLMLSILARRAATNALWKETQRYVTSWGARAAVDSQGFRLVRDFRKHALSRLFKPVDQHLSRFNPAMKLNAGDDVVSAWLEAKPAHLLNPEFNSYESLLEDAVNQTLDGLKSRGIPLSQYTWGHRNRLGIRHPISGAVPGLSRWLDMPDVPVSGDSHMPKVHAPGVGVSERMIVSPGHEENGLYNMPCGQSGHFLSPFYRNEMDAWLKIEPQPFLPGPKRHQLQLIP